MDTDIRKGEEMIYTIIAMLSMALGIGIGSIITIYRCGQILEKREEERDKFKAYYNWFDKWLDKKEKNCLSFDGLKKEKIEKVAIYGKGKIYKHIESELEKNGFVIEYIIDEYVDSIGSKKEVYTLRDEFPMVDLIIVTVISEYQDIRNKILQKDSNIKVISIEELV